jgi:hypothetical protein
MGISRLSLSFALPLLSIALGSGCSSDPNPAGAGAGNFSGTLYFQAEDFGVHKVDLATGAYKLLGKGNYPQKTTQGQLLCVLDNNLADAPEDLLTYRHIDDGSIGSDIFAEGFTWPRQSPDGSKVAYVTNSNKIVVVDFQTGKQIAVITAVAAKVNDVLGFARPSWTPDGRIVFGTALGNEGVYMTDAQFSNTLTRIDAQHLTDVNDPIVSHDGKLIAYTHAKHVWRMGIDGSSPTQINASDTDVDDGPPFWSPDDQTIYWSGYAGNVYFHAAADGNGLPTKIFDLIPSLKDHVLIITSTSSMDWVR